MLLSEAKVGDSLPDYMKDFIRSFESEYSVDMVGLEVPDDRSGIPDMTIALDSVSAGEVSKLVRLKFLDGLSDSFRGSALFRLFRNGRRGFQYNLAKFLIDSLGVSMGDVAKYRGRDSLNFAGLAFGKSFRLPKAEGFDLAGGRYEFTGNKTSLNKLSKWLGRKGYIEQSEHIDGVLGSREVSGLRQAILRSSANLGQSKSDEYYLKISGKPDDKLRISISDYYTSCQNMYDGDVRRTLPAAILDPYSKPAYIISKKEYVDVMGNKHPFTPIIRMIIRNIDGNIVSEPSYPEGYEDLVKGIIEDSGAVKFAKYSASYLFSPKREYGIDIPMPYSDRWRKPSTIYDMSATGLDGSKVLEGFGDAVGDYDDYETDGDGRIRILSSDGSAYTVIAPSNLRDFFGAHGEDGLYDTLALAFEGIKLGDLGKYGDFEGDGDSDIGKYIDGEPDMVKEVADALVSMLESEPSKFVSRVNEGNSDFITPYGRGYYFIEDISIM